MQPKALTLSSTGGFLRVLVSDIKVCEPGAIANGGNADRLPVYKGIWDTGATNSVITQKIVDDLGLRQTGVTKVNGVHGEDLSPVYLVDFLLPLGLIIPGLRVTLGKLPEGTDALIGMDIINLGDFSITNKGFNTKMSFRIPSMHEVDYVMEQQSTSTVVVTSESGRVLSRQERKQLEKQEFQKWRKDQQSKKK